MRKNQQLIENLCTIMYPGAMYPLDVLKQRYMEVFEDEQGMKQIATALRNEYKKNNSKIIRYPTKDAVIWQLNPEFNWEDERVVSDSEDVKRMARVILDSVRKDTKESLKTWLEQDLQVIIQKMMEDEIKKELKTEVIPMLEEYINSSVNNKIVNSRSDFKVLLLSVISDMIKVTIDEDEIGG